MDMFKAFSSILGPRHDRGPHEDNKNYGLYYEQIGENSPKKQVLSEEQKANLTTTENNKTDSQQNKDSKPESKSDSKKNKNDKSGRLLKKDESERNNGKRSDKTPMDKLVGMFKKLVGGEKPSLSQKNQPSKESDNGQEAKPKETEPNQKDDEKRGPEHPVWPPFKLDPFWQHGDKGFGPPPGHMGPPDWLGHPGEHGFSKMHDDRKRPWSRKHDFDNRDDYKEPWGRQPKYYGRHPSEDFYRRPKPEWYEYPRYHSFDPHGRRMYDNKMDRDMFSRPYFGKPEDSRWYGGMKLASGVSGTVESQENETVSVVDTEKPTTEQKKASETIEIPPYTFLLAAQVLRIPEPDVSTANVVAASAETSMNSDEVFSQNGMRFMNPSTANPLQYLKMKVESLQRELDEYKKRYNTCEVYRKRMREALQERLSEQHNSAGYSKTMIMTAVPLIFGAHWLL